MSDIVSTTSTPSAGNLNAASTSSSSSPSMSSPSFPSLSSFSSPSSSSSSSSSSSVHWDISPLLLRCFDSHMILPILEFLQEKKLYNRNDLLTCRVALSGQTRMVDFWASEYKLLNGTEPKELSLRRSSVFDELTSCQSLCGSLISVLNDTEDVATALRTEGNFNFPYLAEKYAVTEENVDALYKFAKLNFECGRYRDAADYLFYFRLLCGSRDEERSFWALWGKLASEILMLNWEPAMLDLNALKEAIDQRVHVDQLEQLQQRTWIIHWSLFIFFNVQNGRALMIDFMMQDKILNTIQMNCPHILRYLTTAVIINKKRKIGNRNVLKDVVRVIQQEKSAYCDPITAFLLAIYVEFDFDVAAKHLRDCEKVIQNDFFLGYIQTEFTDHARHLLFDTYCRIHKTISITNLLKALSLEDNNNNTNSPKDKDEKEKDTFSSSSAESSLVHLIKTSHQEAKIDLATQTLVLQSDFPSTYQQCIEKSKAFIYRTQMMIQQCEKKIYQKQMEKEKEKERNAEREKEREGSGNGNNNNNPTGTQSGNSQFQKDRKERNGDDNRGKNYQKDNNFRNKNYKGQGQGQDRRNPSTPSPSPKTDEVSVSGNFRDRQSFKEKEKIRENPKERKDREEDEENDN